MQLMNSETMNFDKETEQLRSEFQKLMRGTIAPKNGETIFDAVHRFHPDGLIVLDGDITKRNLYQRLPATNPVALATIAGKKGEAFQNARYTPTSLTESDIHGSVTGAKTRFIAGSELYAQLKQNVADYELTVITNTGSIKGSPIHAEVDAKYLEGLGVRETDIAMETSSTNTVENIAETILLAHDRNLHKLIILTNGYHLPRTITFYRSLQDDDLYEKRLDHFFTQKLNETLAKRGMNIDGFFTIVRDMEIEFLSAESILPYRNKRYLNLIAQWKNSEEYQKRLNSELRGYTQLIEGTYGKKINL